MSPSDARRGSPSPTGAPAQSTPGVDFRPAAVRRKSTPGVDLSASSRGSGGDRARVVANRAVQRSGPRRARTGVRGFVQPARFEIRPGERIAGEDVAAYGG